MNEAPRRVRPRQWWPELGLLVGFGTITAVLADGWLLGLDEAVRDWCLAHRSSVGHGVARAANYLGNGSPLALLAAALGALVAWRLRAWWPLLAPIAAFLLTTLTILPLKEWTDRAAPRSPLPDAVRLFNQVPVGEYAESYPSGHVVVAVVWYGVLVLLLDTLLRSYGRSPLPDAWRRVIRVVPVAVVLVTTTYLRYHWLTDGVAGLLCGLLLARLFNRIRWPAAPGLVRQASGSDYRGSSLG